MRKDDSHKRKGYVIAWRAVFMDHPLYPCYRKEKFTEYEALQDLYFLMNGKDKPIRFNGELFEIKRGQFLTSERNLAQRWGWSKTKTSDFLKMLQNSGHSIIKESDHRKTIITWVDYDILNPLDKEKKATENEEDETTKRPLKDHRLDTTNKRVNKGNKRKNSLRLKIEFSDEDIRLTNLLIELMLKNHPKSWVVNELISQHKEDWYHSCWMLREIDKKTTEQIERVIRFSQGDNSWKEQILGMTTLRNKWDKLWAEIEKERSKG